MPRKVVLVESDSKTVLAEVLAHDEAQLRERMKEDPEIVPVEDFGLDGPLLVVGRETPLPAGAVDLIGLTRRGEIVVIEFKTGPQNPDFRHALAQLVDYGAGLWLMSFEIFEQSVAARYFNGPHCPPASAAKGLDSLQEAASKTWSGLTTHELEQFREGVVDSLARGAFHFVVVAQRFTPAMERSVEYMNAQTTHARFYLVEMVRFAADTVEAFEARTVVKPGPKRTTSSGSTSEVKFLEAIADDLYRQRLKEFFDVCRGLDVRLEWGSKGTSMRIKTQDKPEPVSIGWLFPPGATGYMGQPNITLGYEKSKVATVPSLAGALVAWTNSVAVAVGKAPLAGSELIACNLTPDEFLAHYDEIVTALGNLVSNGSSD